MDTWPLLIPVEITIIIRVNQPTTIQQSSISGRIPFSYQLGFRSLTRFDVTPGSNNNAPQHGYNFHNSDNILSSPRIHPPPLHCCLSWSVNFGNAEQPHYLPPTYFSTIISSIYSVRDLCFPPFPRVFVINSYLRCPP